MVFLLNLGLVKNWGLFLNFKIIIIVIVTMVEGGDATHVTV